MTKFGYPPSVATRDTTAKYGPVALPAPKPGTQTGPVNRDNKTTGQSSQRKTERDKKWSLKGWDTNDIADEGIAGWMKRQNILESKKGTKKRSPRLDSETYISVKHECPGIEDTELFHRESFHAIFRPKQTATEDETSTCVKLRYTNKVGVLTPAGFAERDIEEETDEKIAVNTYKVSKSTSTHDGLSERRSRSVQDLAKNQNERSNTYIKIKRLLKFSKKDRRTLKAEDDEDEGYSSKTSSAETKQEPESDGEESGPDRLERQRMYSSMVDLSELPSHSEGGGDNNIRNVKVIGESLTSRVKFSYTHQPTILQLPDPDATLTHDNLRIEKRIESEDTSWSYAKLKRNKELNRCYKPELIQPVEDSTVYDIDNLKPVTLVLRKISIQNADDSVPTVSNPSNTERSSERTISPTRNHSSTGSIHGSRISSAISREGSLSRNGSVKFGAGSSMPILVGSPAPVPGTPRNLSPQQNLAKSPTLRKGTSGLQRVSSAVSQRELQNNFHRCNNVRDVRVVTDNKPKEAMWNHQYSYIDRQTIDRQATNYCIGDLLPAVDKSIYTNNSSKSKFGQTESERQQEELTTSDLLDMNISSVDDGYLLLKKGMDLLTGNGEKPTLGPPPFRPNQTRHPLMRNVTVIIDNKYDYGNKYGPVPGLTRSKTVRVHSDKGPRPMVDEDKETQKRLKDAFTKFYQNRPKEIGKEFRKMETMWKT